MKTHGLAIYAIALAGLAMLAPPARADAVKLEGAWITQVQDVKVADGQVFYTTQAGSDVNRPLELLEGLKLEAYPDLAAAAAAIDAHHEADAIGALSKVFDAAREPWLKQFVASQEVLAHDRAGQPVEAVAAYLRLAHDGAERAYLARPPLKSLKAASAEQKADLLKRVGQARGVATGPVAAALAKMADALGGGIAAAPSNPQNKTAAPATSVPTPAPAPKAVAPTAAAGGAAVPLPKAMDADDPIAVLLTKGQFQQALEASRKELTTPSKMGELAVRLYQQGIAQLYLGEAGHDQKLIKDAGLSFMRVVTYFPQSSYVGPSLIELGLVHDMIGRPDLARKLWDRARLQIGEDDEPQLYARLEKLAAQNAGRNPEKPDKH